ncbi:MAG: GntR family transcriptional regulator [Oscillospiraceae bacterium]|nr:GntR family transcriptional regulator [Oscillospiraceae bacterium]
MKINFEDERPIFLQIAEGIEDGILVGAYPEDGQIPSTTEISVTYKINPATALKGVSRLAEEGILYKRRGLGMFVAEGAIRKVKQKRKAAFVDRHVKPLTREAKRLGLTPGETAELIERSFRDEEN